MKLTICGFGLGDLINFTLQDLFHDGTYQELYEKWFGPPAYGVEIWPLTLEDNLAQLEPVAPSEKPTLETIMERGKIIAGVKYDFKPFGFVDEAGDVVGFDVGLVREFARRWLGDENAVELVQVTSKSRIPILGPRAGWAPTPGHLCYRHFPGLLRRYPLEAQR